MTMTAKNKKIIAAAGVIVGAVALIIGVRAYVSYSVNAALNSAKEEALSKEGYKTDALNTLKSLDSYTSDEAKEKLLSDFENMDKPDCTEIVDTYIYGTYNAAMQYSLTDEETDALIFVTKGGSHEPDLSKLEDKELREKFEELKNEDHIIIRYVNDDIFYDVDYKYFLDSFGSYLNDDYYSLLSLYEEEKNEDYADMANNEFYAGVVEKRLEKLYKLLTDYPNSDIYTSALSSYLFYKAVYLGAYAQDYIFDSGSIRENVLDSYKAYIPNCSDASLKAFLEEITKEYDESNLIRTVPIYESIKKFCSLQQEEESDGE